MVVASFLQHRRQKAIGTDIAVQAVNTLEKATKRVDSEVARKSCRQAESQGGTTIVVGTTVPTPIPVMLVRPDSLPTVPGSSGSLPTLEVLPNRVITPVEEGDLGLAGLF
jgi:hypothetical protein